MVDIISSHLEQVLAERDWNGERDRLAKFMHSASINVHGEWRRLNGILVRRFADCPLEIALTPTWSGVSNLECVVVDWSVWKNIRIEDCVEKADDAIWSMLRQVLARLQQDGMRPKE